MSLEDVEIRHAQKDMGRMAIRIYQGAREESESRLDALWATAAAIFAMVASTRNEEDE